MWVTKDIAYTLESCIKQTHIEVTKHSLDGKIFAINGGAACFSGYDSYLSQVVGWGFTSRPLHFKAEIIAIEQFYKLLGHNRIDIELCPFTGNELALFLSQRGYVIHELNNVSVLDLKIYQPLAVVDKEFTIRSISSDELEQWAKRVAAGFGYPEAEEQFTHYAQAKGVIAFGVFKCGEIIAGATLAMHDEACDLGVTSTISSYREKGLQKKLINHRLRFAQEQGLSLATVTTEPGTISDLNVQKCGFQCAYTRLKLTKFIGA